MTDPLILPADEFEAVKARLAELENAVTWGISCLSCSRVLDSAYTETLRREQAEEKLAEITAVCRSAPSPIRHRILAIIGAEDEGTADA